VLAAVVSRGTLPGQKSVTATLDDLAERAAGLESPALVVGEVVSVGAALASARGALAAA
jgi:siroheme synthase